MASQIKALANGNNVHTIMFNETLNYHNVQICDVFYSVQGDVVSYVNITSLRLEDGGLYRCEAINDAGGVHHSQMIHIKGKPFIRPMGNVTVLAGERLVIRCPASGYPLSRITWFKGMCLNAGTSLRR